MMASALAPTGALFAFLNVVFIVRQEDRLQLHEMVRHVERAPGSYRQGHCIRRTGRHQHDAGIGRKVKLGEVRRPLEIGHDHALDAGAERVDHVDQEIVGQGSRNVDPLKRIGDGGCLWGADEDRQGAPLAFVLLEQEDWRVGLQIDSNGSEEHPHHG